MKIAVSACLLGENCKYNGGNNSTEKVSEYVKGHGIVAEILLRNGIKIIDVADL